MKHFIVLIFLTFSFSLLAQNKDTGPTTEGNASGDYALLSSYEWLFSTNNNYHCKVKESDKEVAGSVEIEEPKATGLNVLKFNVYPNPAQSNYLNVEFESDDDEAFNLRVSDINGNLLYTRDVPENPGVFNHLISLDQFNSSIVIISIHKGNDFVSQKLVISK